MKNDNSVMLIVIFTLFFIFFNIITSSINHVYSENYENKKQYVIKNDLGGNIIKYVNNIKKLRQSNKKVIVDGICYSACTMYLSLKNICITDNSKFMFHSPINEDRTKDLNQKDFLYYVSYMTDNYPVEIAVYFLKNALDELEFNKPFEEYFSAKEMHEKFNIKLCK